MAYKRHPIETIEGIGKERSAQLRKAGITATEDLLILPEAQQLSIMNKIPEFPVAQHYTFIACAQFLLIDSLTGQNAEALVRAGRPSLYNLSLPDPDTIVDELEEAKKNKLIPEGIDLITAVRWQKQALEIQYTGAVMGIVKSEDGPIEGAVIYCAGRKAETDTEGKFYLPVIPFGKSEIIIRAEGRSRFRTFIHVRPENPKVKLNVKLTSEIPKVKETDEADGRPVRRITADDRIVFIDTDLDQIADGTPFIFQRFKKNGTGKLSSAYRTRKGNEILISRIEVPKGTLDETAQKGQIFIWKGEKFIRSEESLRDIRRRLAMGALEKLGEKVKMRKIPPQLSKRRRIRSAGYAGRHV
ncbi:DUF4332 domain-containing protein [Thermodesulfobacteriota bacterium]